MTKLNESITNELARKLHNVTFAIPDKPIHKMTEREYAQRCVGEFARELLFWLAGRTGAMETFIMFPTEGMHVREEMEL